MILLCSYSFGNNNKPNKIYMLLCSPDVAALLSTMPILRQPAPPPGIPAGIPPMRKADAPTSQVPCKHFAQGNCQKGDRCEFAHELKQQGRAAARNRSANRQTPPVCNFCYQEQQVLLNDSLSVKTTQAHVNSTAQLGLYTIQDLCSTHKNCLAHAGLCIQVGLSI